MAFVPVDYTDGTSIRTARSAADAAQFQWEGWYIPSSPPSPPGPSAVQLHQTEAQLLWLFTDPELYADFTDWFLTNSGGTIALTRSALLTESSSTLVAEDGTVLILG